MKAKIREVVEIRDSREHIAREIAAYTYHCDVRQEYRVM
jgi:hypothetical protein